MIALVVVSLSSKIEREMLSQLAAPTAGELWQASGFSGAELPFAALLGAFDQRGAALEFFGDRLKALTAS